MNDLLLSEIDSEQNNLLASLALIEEHIFQKNVSENIQQALSTIIETCRDSIEGIDEPMAQAECLINALYVDELFIDQERNRWPLSACLIESSIGQRVISPVLKAVIIQHIANQCDLEAEVVYVPEKVMVRIICDDLYSIIFDPITGESINWEELDRRLEGINNESLQPHLPPMECKSIVLEHLTLLKNVLIIEKRFDYALVCVDLILSIRPDDPFERRDRGFLLHQLDCFKVAYDDYQYFVDACPKDPAAQLLKLQLDNISVAETVLH
ncbi:SirB1 family protein [Thalassotalea marina]|uniref:Transcriptional regulator n=1 Tax=Thalassotalea marina TaxID=1673741 RepID=A0A919ELE4_9GAMM|nr:tetratricopeptide repeat protein [Thalassotalea marina]GHF95551.1 transcriptional regulator [Thalassotalea marina]